jgi:hypothetical protein
VGLLTRTGGNGSTDDEPRAKTKVSGEASVSESESGTMRGEPGGGTDEGRDDRWGWDTCSAVWVSRAEG